MAYAYSQLGMRLFRAKILESNLPSIALFASLNFKEVGRVAVFQEVHMELVVEGDVEESMRGRASRLRFRQYDDDSLPS